jgi:Carboxypeptidase regulatory-like domain
LGLEAEEISMATQKRTEPAEERAAPARESALVAESSPPDGQDHCPPPDEGPLVADAEECGGDLRVMAFAYADAEGTGTYQDGQGDTPLSGVEVTVTGVDGDTPFSDCQRTEAGVAFWPGLKQGKYRVTVLNAGPWTSQYGAPQAYHVTAGKGAPEETKPADPVAVTPVATTGVGIGFRPRPTCIRVLAFWDANGTGDPHCQRRINNVRVDFCDASGERLACGETHDDCFEQTIARPGLIAVVPQASVKAGNRSLRAVSDRILVATVPGGCQGVAVAYRLRQTELRVGACLMRDVHGKTEKGPLRGVVEFALHRGNTVGSQAGPVVGTSSQGDPAVFRDLDVGSTYTLVAVSWPKHINGVGIKLDSPPGGAVTVTLTEAPSDLRNAFCFKPCLGRVMGTVVDDACGEGVDNAPVVVSRADGRNSSLTATSTAEGIFVIDGVPPGNYVVRLEESRFNSLDGKSWELSPSQPAEQAITVPACATGQVPAFRVTQDIHKVFGQVRSQEGKPIPFAVVNILNDAGKPQCTVHADEDGNYECVLERAGKYFVAVQGASGPDQWFPAEVHSAQQRNVTAFTQTGSPAPPPPPPNGQAAESLIDATAYPILTEEISYAAGPRPAAPGGAGAAPLGQIVEGALRDVLGWRPKTTDPKGFTAALTQAFALTEVAGHTEWKWTPRSYTVQTDLGAVTGAQASIYTRAKVALDQSLPLLEGLHPLVPSVDAEDLESLRGIVSSELGELVSEFGVEGGPRVARVDQLFGLLTGSFFPSPPPSNPEQLGQGAMLKTLADRFGLNRSFVNTIDDEQNLTNYLILVDYVLGLQQSWTGDQRQYFTRGNGTGSPQPFFGTQLVLLSRALEVVAESVQSVAFALDSVFVGPAERQTLELKFPADQPIWIPYLSGPGGGLLAGLGRFNFPDNTPSLFVAELLEWVQRVASQEGPRLVKEGGKDGITAFKQIANDLRKFAHGALIRHSLGGTAGSDGTQDKATLPPAYRTPRVQRALQELADQLDETYKLAFPIIPPQFP